MGWLDIEVSESEARLAVKYSPFLSPFNLKGRLVILKKCDGSSEREDGIGQKD